MDVESLKRRKCLDGFLVVSVVLLFMAVLSLFAGGVILLTVMNSNKEDGKPPSVYYGKEKQTDYDSPSYKMQDFAYLHASSSNLQNRTMTWQAKHHGAVNSIGEHFHFDPKHHSLHPKRNGYYFIYFQLNLTCSYKCKAVHLTLSFGDKLACKVDLPSWAETTPVSKKCWTVAQLDGESRLFTQMTISEKGPHSWKLDLNSSGLGVFLLG